MNDTAVLYTTVQRAKMATPGIICHFHIVSKTALVRGLSYRKIFNLVSLSNVNSNCTLFKALITRDLLPHVLSQLTSIPDNNLPIRCIC